MATCINNIVEIPPREKEMYHNEFLVCVLLLKGMRHKQKYSSQSNKRCNDLIPLHNLQIIGCTQACSAYSNDTYTRTHSFAFISLAKALRSIFCVAQLTLIMWSDLAGTHIQWHLIFLTLSLVLVLVCIWIGHVCIYYIQSTIPTNEMPFIVVKCKTFQLYLIESNMIYTNKDLQTYDRNPYIHRYKSIPYMCSVCMVCVQYTHVLERVLSVSCYGNRHTGTNHK